MCETCGCANHEGFVIRDPKHAHEHTHADGTTHSHEHHHDHSHEHGNDHHELEHTQAQSSQKIINLNIDILASNNITAAMNRRFFEGRKVMCLNMVSSPGSGKTTLLEKTIAAMTPDRKIYVIEGDQQTVLDADRIERAGAPALQINTGSGCHLDARMIEAALGKIRIDPDSLLFIENVGNLVCPALFDLGEYKRVLTVSVTEGDDKPLKYPNMFESSHLCIINKSDLLPYVDFRPEEFMKNARHINNRIEFLGISAKTGSGIDRWIGWIQKQLQEFQNR